MVTIMADQTSQDSAYAIKNSGPLPSIISNIHNNSLDSDSLPISSSRFNTLCGMDENSDISNCAHIQFKNLYHSTNDEYNHNNSFSKSYSDIFTQPYLLQNHAPISHQTFETYPHNNIVPTPMTQEDLQWSQCYNSNYFANQDSMTHQYNNRLLYHRLPSYSPNFYSNLQLDQTQISSSYPQVDNQIFSLPTSLSTQSSNQISTNIKSKEPNQIRGKLIDTRDSNNENCRDRIDSLSKENASSQNQSSKSTKAKSSSSDIAKMFETFHSSGEFKTSFYNPFEVKHRRRTSKYQFKILERAFQENCKPSTQIRRELAIKLGMTMRGVQVWFQNRRAKLKNVPKITLSNRKNMHNLENEIGSDEEENDFEAAEDCLKGYESVCSYTTLNEDINKENDKETDLPKERINDDFTLHNQKEKTKQEKEGGLNEKQNSPSAGVLVFNEFGEQIYQGVKLDSVNYNQSEKMISKIANRSESKSSNSHSFNTELVSMNINAISPSSIHPLFPTLPTILPDSFSNGKKRSSSYPSGTFSSVVPEIYCKEQIYLHDNNINISQFTSTNTPSNTSIAYDCINNSFNQTIGSEPRNQSFPTQTILPFHTHRSDIAFGQDLYPCSSQYHYTQSLSGLNSETASSVSRNRTLSMPTSEIDAAFIPQPLQFTHYYSTMDPSLSIFYDPYMPHYSHPLHAQPTQISHETTNIDTKLPEISISDCDTEISRHDLQQSMDHDFITHKVIDSIKDSNRDIHDSRESLQFVSSSHSLINTNPHEIDVFSGIRTSDKIAKMNSENGYIFDNIHQNRLPQKDNIEADGFLYQHSMDRTSISDSVSNEYESNHVHGNILNTKNNHDRNNDVDDVSYPVW